MLYVSLNGFAADILSWTHNPKLDVRFLTWSDLRADLLASVNNYASVLLDEFELTTTQAATVQNAATLHFDTVVPIPLSQFPEFITVANSLELWLRRMPRFPLQLAQTTAGQFWYDAIAEQVKLIPGCTSDLSLQEAWAIQDTLSGYANRTYNAVRATAQALAALNDGLIADVQIALRKLGWKTGPDGIRRSLDFLVQLGLACKRLERGKSRYTVS